MMYSAEILHTAREADKAQGREKFYKEEYSQNGC